MRAHEGTLRIGAKSVIGIRNTLNCWIDISDTLERKIDALFCHTSQLPDEAGEWFRDFLRERAEDAGAADKVKYAEPFRKLTFRR